MNAFATIRLELIERGVTRLTLQRPERHNALSGAMIAELTEAARLIAADRSQRVVILAGEGKSFCAGGDLGWMREQFAASREQRQGQAKALAAMLRALDELPQLVVGLVQGAAYGGGVGLLAVCDVVISAPEARFALTETRLGLIPATIAPFLLRRISLSGLRRIGLHGPVLGAEEARQIGLVSEIADGDLHAVAERHVCQLLACAPHAVAEAKALFRALAAGEADEGAAVTALVTRWQSEEARQGIGAFFAREAPPWRM